MRADRCLVGAACEVRAERERALGALASSLAPLQPIGDPSLFRDSPVVSRQRRSGPWRAALLVLAIAGVAAFGGGPALTALSSLFGASDGAGESATPTAEASASPAARSTPSPSTAASTTPSPTPTPSPAASAGSGKTYVVQRGDTLYQIGIDLNIEGGYKVLAELNGIKGPDYTIKPGQVLQLP